MNLYQKLQSDLIAAQKEKNSDKVSTLRLLINDAKNSAINSGGDRSNISDDETLKALNKAMKQRKESIAVYEQNNRNDLAEHEKAELAIIEEYLPRMMSLEEIKKEIKPLVEQSTDNNFGLLMKKSMEILKGKANPSDVKSVIESLMKK